MRFATYACAPEDSEDALAIVERYFPPDRIRTKTRFALQEILKLWRTPADGYLSRGSVRLGIEIDEGWWSTGTEELPIWTER
jgi:hypothetical protein